MVWASDEKRGTLRRKEGDGNESTREKEERTKTVGQNEGGGMISKRRDCRRRMCTAVLHGGVCHSTSTPHKSGNNMKRRKKKKTNIDKSIVLHVKA